MHGQRKLRVAVVHPDLGIGGAERLIVDVCVGLQKLGHDVEIYTMRHEKERCFRETSDGTLKVTVLGSTPIPRALPVPGTKRTILNTPLQIARQAHLTFTLIAQQVAYQLSLPFVHKTKPFDVIFMDQLSASIPLFRWFSGTRVVFYVHFPDLLLADGKNKDMFGNSLGPPKTMRELFKRAYRAPLNNLEELTTGEADLLLSNSEFTSTVFTRTFPYLLRRPIVVYPGINTSNYGSEALVDLERSRPEFHVLQSQKRQFLSINRFEKKKNIELALRAFAELHRRRNGEDIRLIIAGGYDIKLQENIRVLYTLQKLADELALSHHTYSSTLSPARFADNSPSISNEPNLSATVLFLLNISDAQKIYLLSSAQTIALLYTPSHEHLGIVPLESMACELPVIATDDQGGPKETVVDSSLGRSFDAEEWSVTSTGFLRPPVEPAWTDAMEHILDLTVEQRKRVGETGRRRVAQKFSLNSMSKSIEKALYDVVHMDGFEGEEPTRQSIPLEEGFMKFVFAIFMACVAFATLVYLFRDDIFPQKP